MEKYVVSREMARVLERKGYPQRTSVYGWITAKADPNDILLDTLRGHSEYELQTHEIVSAPLIDELLEQLPDKIDGKYVEVILHNTVGFNFARLAVGYLGKYEALKRYVESYEPDWDNDNVDERSRPDALAQLWLYCKENGYINGEKQS